MNTKAFSAAVESAIGARVAFGDIRIANTNNDWGFGGWSGTVLPFTIGDRLFEYRDGHAYFRHLSCRKVNVVVELSVEQGGVLERYSVKSFLKNLLTGA